MHTSTIAAHCFLDCKQVSYRYRRRKTTSPIDIGDARFEKIDFFCLSRSCATKYITREILSLLRVLNHFNRRLVPSSLEVLHAP